MMQLTAIAGKRISGSRSPPFLFVNMSATQSLHAPPKKIATTAPIAVAEKHKPDCHVTKPYTSAKAVA